MSMTTLGIDLAKTVFHVQGRDVAGRPVFQKRFSRAALVKFMANLPSCRVGLEVCSGANHWSRTSQAFGHDVRLISPQFIKPYVKTNKNDFNDAEAICEAVLRPTMRFVTPKTVAQQDLQNVHRVRRRLIGVRTALVNQIRGLLADYGVVVPQQVSHLRHALSGLLEDPTNTLTPLARMTFTALHDELRGLDARVTAVDHELTRHCAGDERCQRLTAIEGGTPPPHDFLGHTIGAYYPYH